MLRRAAELLAAVCLLLSAPAFAQDFSLGSAKAADIPAVKLPEARLAAVPPAAARAEAEAWFARVAPGGHSLKHLSTGAESFRERLTLIRSAQRSIFLSAFAFDHDASSRMFVDELCRKAAEGVEVRMLIDSLGGSYMKDIRNDVRDCGVTLLFYAPAYWGLDYVPQALHEKLLIVDGERLQMGGMGWSDKYGTSSRDDAKWYDQDLRIDGPAACRFHRSFVETFRKVARKERETRYALYGREDSEELQDYLYGSKYFNDCDEVKAGDARVLPAYNNPVFGAGQSVSMEAYVKLAAASSGTIDIYSPYLVLHEDAAKALAAAAARGVRVRFLTNSRVSTDEPLAQAALFAGADKLLEAGVEIYLWPRKSVLHRKGGVFDGRWAFLGSDNFDRRGQLYSSESVAFTDDPALAARERAELDADFSIAVKLTPELARSELSHIPAIRRWLSKLAKPFL